MEQIASHLTRMPNLSERAATALTEEIINGRYKLGQKLVETDVASALGISRATLREALSGLAREGLVIQRQGRGSFVASPTEGELAELAFFRASLESTAARLIVRNRPSGVLTALRKHADKAEAAVDRNDLRRFRDNVWQYHLRLMEGGGNRFALQAWLSISNLFRLYISRLESSPVEASTVICHLRSFVRALEGDNPDLAEKLLKSMIIFVSFAYSGRQVSAVYAPYVTHNVSSDGEILEIRG